MVSASGSVEFHITALYGDATSLHGCKSNQITLRKKQPSLQVEKARRVFCQDATAQLPRFSYSSSARTVARHCPKTDLAFDFIWVSTGFLCFSFHMKWEYHQQCTREKQQVPSEAGQPRWLSDEACTEPEVKQLGITQFNHNTKHTLTESQKHEQWCTCRREDAVVNVIIGRRSHKHLWNIIGKKKSLLKLLILLLKQVLSTMQGIYGLMPHTLQ